MTFLFQLRENFTHFQEPQNQQKYSAIIFIIPAIINISSKKPQYQSVARKIQSLQTFGKRGCWNCLLNAKLNPIIDVKRVLGDEKGEWGKFENHF